MALSWNEMKARAIGFSKTWADATNEDSEAKPFWLDFFEIFGITNKRVATFELNVKKHGGGQGFVDLFWPGMLLVEQKSRGKNLDKAFSQALDYFPGIPERDLPQLVIVSDFARFRVYNLETGDTTEFDLKDLHKNVKLFGFIAGYKVQDIRAQDPVNIRAAERMGKLHDALKASGYDGHALEVLLVRLLFCLYADDTGIFQPANALRTYIEERTTVDGSDLGSHLAKLFQVLNTEEEKRSTALDEQLAQFPYVNGGLFQETLPIADFTSAMREQFLDACALDWSAISPAIFGSLFQSIMDADARRNLGAHYTSEENILKLIKPLFLDDLYAEFEKIKKVPAKLQAFHKKLRSLKFLDPACGCGNFLVISYRELRALELEVIRASQSLTAPGQQTLDVQSLIQVDVDQFYGIEIEEFPAQIAQVALWLLDHQANLRVSEEFGDYFARIPLRTTPHIVHENALHINWNDVLPASECSYVLGNPPFIGHHLQSESQKQDMLQAYGSDAKSAGVMDFVTAWYLLAARYIKGTSVKTAFVSTNSITQGEQVGIMWRAIQKIGKFHIHFAHRTFKWSNEAKGKAAVYCVIVCLAESQPNSPIIFEYESVNSEPLAVIAKQINAYLVDAAWVLLNNRSTNPFGAPEMMYGSKPTDGGYFLLDDQEKTELLQQEPAAAKFVKPFIGAHEYLHNEKRWVIWLVGATPAEINALPKIKERVQAVDAFRKASKAATTRNYPYPTLFRQVTQPKNSYVLIPGHTSENRTYIPFGFFSADTIVGNSCFSLPEATLFHYGVIQSRMHMAWVRYTCGRIKSDYRYSKDIVYNNYVWPGLAGEALPDSRRSAIEMGAQAVLDARAKSSGTLADLYDPILMPQDLIKAHNDLDKAVDAAYGYKGSKDDASRVAFIFALYQRITSLLPIEKPKRTPKNNPARS
jgi:hypothetical protein